jgi:hypothetical protein
MESNFEFEKVSRYKDGDTRDRRGRWSGKVVTVRKEHYALIETWRKKTGINKAQFWREAVMRGAVEVAKSYGINASFPALEDEVKPVKERASYYPFKFWNIKKTSNGLRYPRWGGRRNAVRLGKC